MKIPAGDYMAAYAEETIIINNSNININTSGFSSSEENIAPH